MKLSVSRLNQISSNRWFVVGLLLVSGALLSSVAITFDDKSVPLPLLTEKPEAIERIVPVKRIDQLSSDLTIKPTLPFAEGHQPFFTMHFKPVPPAEPAPTQPPTPPPPALKKFVLLFQGMYQTADGLNQAFVKLDNKLLVVPPGGNLLKDWDVAEISRQKLTLTNRAAETTILEFNREKTLELPE